ncbi:glycoside hydrolase family 26 protein [Actinoplanes sp. M2I2]|uniref:glycoside hydrolase family 26 protein n=1 Tax=Actinoplanes sp. M2I2 TaxID=1734444 RepID=UPI0020222053|nr:glycosyl hydrolase [Actinoplanes sp. M2I2]
MRRRQLLGLGALAAAAPLAGCGKEYRSDDAVPPVVPPSAFASGEAVGGTPVVTAGGGAVPFEPGKVLLGAYVDLSGRSVREGLDLRRRQLGRPERIVHRYYSWEDELPVGVPYVSSRSTLMISWRGPAYREVVGGGSDKLIARAARRLAERGRPTLVRWAWDMNRDFYEWGGPANNRDTAGYITAFRRVHDIFADEGADNVSWVWSPNGTSRPGEDWNSYEHYYPGDEYVDWAGVSGFAQTQTPAGMFEEFYQTYATRKPIMISEVSAIDRGGRTKPDWIASFRTWVKAHPAVGAAVWFDTDTHPTSRENWRIDSTAASLAAYKAMSNDPVFIG